MTTTALKEDRLNIRVSNQQKQMLAEAARCRHLTTSQFIVQASLDAAEQVLADQTVIKFTPEQWDEFQQRLDEPARFLPALHALLSEPDPF